MLNNITTDSSLFKEFTKWLETANNGFWDGLEDDAVDTAEPIENFFENKNVRIMTDITIGGIRRVHAVTSSKNSQYKNTATELAMMSDGKFTLVIK